MSSYEPQSSGAITGSDYEHLKCQSAQNPTGFNTLYLWGSWNAAEVHLQCSPNFDPADPASAQWFDVDGTNSQLSADGKVDFQTRAAAYRLKATGVTSVNFVVI